LHGGYPVSVVIHASYYSLLRDQTLESKAGVELRLSNLDCRRHRPPLPLMKAGSDVVVGSIVRVDLKDGECIVKSRY
jgi:hypothetical protein